MSASPQNNHTASESSLPDGWASAFSTKHDKVYYYNRITKEKVWSIPSAPTVPLSKNPMEWEVEEENGWSTCDQIAQQALRKACNALQDALSFYEDGFCYTFQLISCVRKNLKTGRHNRLRVRRNLPQVAETLPNPMSPARKRLRDCEEQSLIGVTEITSNRTAHPPTECSMPAFKHARIGSTDDTAEHEDSKSTGNCRIIEILEEMAAIQRVKRDFFRARAYESAVDLLQSTTYEIISGRQARKMKGIGDGIARRIEEIIQTGSLKELEDLKRDDDVLSLRQLRAVHGIGVVRAEELVLKGIRSICDLRSAVATGAACLDATQKVGLAYVDDLMKKVPRVEMVEHEAFLKKMQLGCHLALTLVVCGSYRRGKAASGDIDVLITTEGFTLSNPLRGRDVLPAFVRHLRAAGYIVADLAAGEKKYMGICRLPGENRVHRRIDIRCLPQDQFHFGTLYFTGSRQLNVRMRLQALQRGWTLNEYSLMRRDSGCKIPASSERDIFQILGMEYLDPHQR